MTTGGQLDRLVQETSRGRRCHWCGRPATCMHHIIPRWYKLLRWDPKNHLPACNKLRTEIIDGEEMEFLGCHQMYHDGFLEYTPSEYLNHRRNADFKNYLIFKSLTVSDFMAKSENKLKKVLKKLDR